MPTQGSQNNAKDDTLYYAVGAGFANLATDLSQFADNQTSAATWTYEASPASRFNVTTTWTFEFDVTTDSNDTGYLVSYGSGGSLLAVSLNGSGSLQARLGASVLATFRLPGIGAGAERFAIAWSCEPNLLTTGAANALRSEIRAWNLTDGSYDQMTFTHATRTAATGNLVCWASSTAGANSFNGTPHAIRISAGRFRTATETRQDFVGLTTAPTITRATRIEFPVVNPGCQLGDPMELSGPVYAMGAASVRSMGLRSLSPIVNEVILERDIYEGASFTNLPTHWRRAAPDPAYTLFGNFLFYRVVPAFVDRVAVRVQAQQWRTSGATPDRVHLRVYSFNRPPHPVADVVDGDAGIVAQATTGTLQTDHGSSAADGEWTDCGHLRVARNSAGCTWLCLAVRVENLSGNTALNRLRIQAINIDPVVTE